jgi:hypothetical protein
MWRVRWKKSTLEDLAKIWTAADSTTRQSITDASHVIEQVLRGNPEEQGESRPGGRRIMFVGPLGVLFRVRTEKSIVQVLQVWRIL